MKERKGRKRRFLPRYCTDWDETSSRALLGEVRGACEGALRLQVRGRVMAMAATARGRRWRAATECWKSNGVDERCQFGTDAHRLGRVARSIPPPAPGHHGQQLKSPPPSLLPVLLPGEAWGQKDNNSLMAKGSR